jgi:TonB-dependent receptor
MKEFSFFYKLLIVFLLSRTMWCQTARVSGKVTDATTNQTLIGTNVYLVGTGWGASTDGEGNYSILGVRAGSYKIQISYIGYETITDSIQLKNGQNLVRNFKLVPVGVIGKAVTVTAQANGQNAAINQQLASENIVNVVSSARLQDLPDANAAESVGRLPGVYLLRSGGEGYAVSIRGLQPKYNKVLIDGVEMPASSSDDRSVDMSMISSDMLSGIEVYKTVTPDMDAAVLGGTVNFQIREAKQSPTSEPKFNFSLQGGYNGLQNAYNNYKFDVAVGKRFFDNRLGILIQGIIEEINLTSDVLGGNYYIPDKARFPDQVEISDLNLNYQPSDRHRYNGTIVIDYRLPNGKIDLMNFFSQQKTTTDDYNVSYGLMDNEIQNGAGVSYSTLNVITNLLDYQQSLSKFKIEIRLSHAYTENIDPGSWTATFNQSNAGINTISAFVNPVQIAQIASKKTDLNNLIFQGSTLDNSFLRRREVTGAIDIQREFDISNVVATVKFGGVYRYKSSYFDYYEEDGSYSLGGNVPSLGRRAILQAFPWITQPPYNLNPDGSQTIPVKVFSDPNINLGKFLNGSYTLGTPNDLGLIQQAIFAVRNAMLNNPITNYQSYAPDEYASGGSDYSGSEYGSAGYIMWTFKIGQLTLIPGVRYQALKTSYNAPIYDDVGSNPYPHILPYHDTTANKYHGFWLPDFIVKYKPLTWFSVNAAYTNTLTYPDISELTPRIDIETYPTENVTWNNANLEPAHSQNYDVAFSFYDNSIGLLTVDGFLKQIDNLIFQTGTRYITNPSNYPGLPGYTKGYPINTAINNPFRVNDWGIELDWQTHFWYLPWSLNGLVMNVNYTHIFSQAKYPYTITEVGGYPNFKLTYVDTFYTDRLIDQPDDIVNLSLGYDYEGFSVAVSLIDQSDVFTGSDFWPSLRSSKASYLRWDLVLKQDLPWYGIQVFANLNNLNGANDISLIRGSGFPTSESSYGITAALGLRWNP